MTKVNVKVVSIAANVFYSADFALSSAANVLSSAETVVYSANTAVYCANNVLSNIA